MVKTPGGKLAKWTPAQTQQLEDLKAEAIEAQVNGDTKGAIAAAKKIEDLKMEVRRVAQMRAGRRRCGTRKQCKGLVKVTVTSKKDAGRIGEDILKRSSKMMG